MTYDKGILRADEGKTLRRISDKQMFGTEIRLGNTWYINGTRLKHPLKELPEHYEELTQEEIDAEEKRNEAIRHQLIGEKVDALIRRRYTLSEELSILRQRDVKPEEFALYNDFCEECKREVRNNI